MFDLLSEDDVIHVIAGCINPEEFREFKLVKRAQLSHNVAKFTFELPTPTSVLGLPIGQHISCRFHYLIVSNLLCACYSSVSVD